MDKLEEFRPLDPSYIVGDSYDSKHLNELSIKPNHKELLDLPARYFPKFLHDLDYVYFGYVEPTEQHGGNYCLLVPVKILDEIVPP